MQSSAERRFDARLAQLTQAQPKLEDLSRSGALQADLPAVIHPLGRLHVGQTRCKGLTEMGPVPQQQQG